MFLFVVVIRCRKNEGRSDKIQRCFVAFHLDRSVLHREMHKLTIKSITLRYGAINSERVRVQKARHTHKKRVKEIENGKNELNRK